MSVLYDLEWRLADDTPVGSVSGVTTVDYYDISGLTACTTYEWRVRADDAGEKSDWSAWSSFQTALVTTAVDIAVAAPLPVINTGASVSVPATDIALAAPLPSIWTGSAVSVPATDILLLAPLPVIATGVVLTVPSVNILLAAPNIPFVGQRPDGVDRPRVVSATPQHRVSHPA